MSVHPDHEGWETCGCPACRALGGILRSERKIVTAPNGRKLELVDTILLDELQTGVLALQETRDLFADLWPGEEFACPQDGDRPDQDHI
jgi:hypothetical protein